MFVDQIVSMFGGRIAVEVITILLVSIHASIEMSSEYKEAQVLIITVLVILAIMDSLSLTLFLRKDTSSVQEDKSTKKIRF